VDTKTTFDKVYNGIMNFFSIESPARAEWANWLTNIVPRTDNVIEYLHQNHEMKRPLESFFDQQNPMSWASENSTVYEHVVVYELEPSDWEYPNMNTAIVQPSVSTRFNPHPPDPLAFFYYNIGFALKFSNASTSYYDQILSKMTVDSMKEKLRLVLRSFSLC
jgi:hypothetical protein